MSLIPELDRLRDAIVAAERKAAEVGIDLDDLDDLGDRPDLVGAAACSERWSRWCAEDPFEAIAWNLDMLGSTGNRIDSDGVLGSVLVFDLLDSMRRLVVSATLCWSAAIALHQNGVDPSEIPQRIAEVLEIGLDRDSRSALRVVVDYVEIDLEEIQRLGWTSILTSGLILWYLGIGSQDPIRRPSDPADPEIVAVLVETLEAIDAALQDAPEDVETVPLLLDLLGVEWFPLLLTRNRLRTAEALRYYRGTADGEDGESLVFGLPVLASLFEGVRNARK